MNFRIVLTPKSGNPESARGFMCGDPTIKEFLDAGWHIYRYIYLSK